MAVVTASAAPAYTVRRSSRARRARLTISEAGDAVVVLPMRSPERHAHELVDRHLVWIERHRRRLFDRRVALAERPALGEGRTISLGGLPHRVVIRPGERRLRSVVRLADGTLVVELADADDRSVGQVLERWLRTEARRAIRKQLESRAVEMGLSFTAVSIRDQRSRWGSASRRGALSFSWRLLLCPPDVLDYVVVHELAHLRVAGHSAAFWRLVDRFAMDSRAARRWLRENQHETRRALD
jgi:predicted metal-dependent hydrolase